MGLKEALSARRKGRRKLSILSEKESHSERGELLANICLAETIGKGRVPA